VHDSILRGQIIGNEGMHQSAMAAAAVVLDDPELTPAWLDWIFAPRNSARGDVGWGDLARILEEKVDADGMGSEGAPAYNGIWRRMFRCLSDTIDLYRSYKGRRIRDFPRYRKMFETPVRLIVLGRFIPNIGDNGQTGAPGTGNIKVEELLYAYRTFRDPIFAQMAHFLSDGRSSELHEGIFEAEPEAIKEEIEEVVRRYGPYVPRTEELSAYGLAILRSGAKGSERALSIYYGRNTGHGHRDTLNIELFGYGLNLMPDLGYPEYATKWPPRYEWTANTISHNTVVVDRTKQRPSYSGKSRFVVESGGVSAAEIYADKVYPQTSLYQRTSALVDISESQFYVVDIFRVRGGTECHYSLHGPEGEVSVEGLNLASQAKGTLAGEDIAFGADLGGRENNWENASGFQYLYDVRRDPRPGPIASVEWNVKDTWAILGEPRDIRLRMTLVNPPGEIVLAHGDPPRNKPGNPRRLTYVICAHKGPESTFVTIIEPYSGQSAIREIKREDDDGTISLTIGLASGRTDHIISAPRSGPLGRGFSGRFCVFSEANGQMEQRLLVP